MSAGILEGKREDSTAPAPGSLGLLIRRPHGRRAWFGRRRRDAAAGETLEAPAEHRAIAEVGRIPDPVEELRQKEDQLAEELENLKHKISELERLANSRGLSGVLFRSSSEPEQTKAS